jgi:hypothetical protein
MIQAWVLMVLSAKSVMAWQPFPIQFAQSVSGRTVSVCLDGRQVKTTFAGKLVLKDGKFARFSVCADVRAPVVRGQVYPVRPMFSKSAGVTVALAGNIVAKYFRHAQTADQCAGLQLAVWEAIEDGGPVANFAAGRFQARANEYALRFAQEYYQAIEENGDALFLQAGNGNGQSQITAV